MSNFVRLFILLVCIMLAKFSFAQSPTIALTIDDLPFVGNHTELQLHNIIQTLKNEAVPVTGFVIAGEIKPNDWEFLHELHDLGASIGNHTLTHANLNKMNAQAFIREIAQADAILAPVLTMPKFFRYPYLATSNGYKENRVAAYLFARHYLVAPVTIDSKDFIFNQLLRNVAEKQRVSFLPVLKNCYLNFIWQQTLRAQIENKRGVQILLIHANSLNAYFLPDIIHMYKERGFKFVSLEEALTPTKHQPEVPVRAVSQRSGMILGELGQQVKDHAADDWAWD